MPDQWLAIPDADGIDEYVFSPHELKLIRGASALQAELNLRDLPAEVRRIGEIIFAGGGAVLGKFPAEGDAEELCERAQRLYAQKTQIASRTTAYVRYSQGSLGASVRELRTLLERRKPSRCAPRQNGSSPSTLSCQACGLYPASEVVCQEEAQKPVCVAWRVRPGYRHRSAYHLAGRRPVNDFGRIGAPASPHNYVPVLHIDAVVCPSMTESIPGQRKRLRRGTGGPDPTSKPYSLSGLTRKSNDTS